MDMELEDIQLSVRRFLSEPFEEKILERNMKNVVHYTTAEGLTGIVDTRSFFASRSDFLNDYTEMQYCWDLLLRIINSLTKECVDKNGCNEQIEFYKKVEEEAKLYRIEVGEQEELFVLSFTENKDSLAMWSHYAGTDGYNIEIDLRRNLGTWSNLPGIQFRYGAVIYNKNKQKEILKKEIDRALFMWNSIVRINKKWDYLIVDALMYRIKIWSMFLKNSLFEEEKEVRVAFFRLNSDFATEKLEELSNLCYPESDIEEMREKGADFVRSMGETANLPKEFRVRNNIIYPYIKVPFDVQSIMGVNVGPINKIDKAILGINMYLTSKGLTGINVDRSKCPLRF